MLQHVGFIEHSRGINFRNPVISFCEIAHTMTAPSITYIKIVHYLYLLENITSKNPATLLGIILQFSLE